MSKQLDERVVSMKFDNKQFEQGIKQTQSSLKNFNEALNFDKVTAGLGKISVAAQNVKMDALHEAAEKASSGFKAFEVAAITALANITSKVVDSALQWGKSLILDAPTNGFREYETQINAVQTILANTLKEGTNVQAVNKYLDQLNDYADKTIYNFTEMTRNIGTFTAAGVKLEPAVKSIKGLANVAALSGTNSQKASGAMYQMSQAMAAGRVALQDWISMEQAGMGGQQIQELLKDTARAMGLVDKLDKKTRNKFEHGSFRESLKGGWLTTDVMTRALEVMGGEMSKADLMAKGYTESQAEYYEKLGQTALKAATEVKTFSQLLETIGEAQGTGWAQTWRIILGDFDEAKELFTWLSDVLGKVIGESADARNQMWQQWRDLGGRTAIINALKNVLVGIGRILGPIRDAWHAVFPPTMGTIMAEISKGLERITQGLILSEPNAEKLKRIFQGLFSVFSLVTQAVAAVARGIGALLNDLISLLPRGNGSILEFVAGLADWVTNLANAAKESDFFLKQVQAFGDWVKWLVNVATPYIVQAGEAIGRFGVDVWRTLGDFAQKAQAKFEELKAFLVPAAQGTAEAANKELGKIGEATTSGSLAAFEKIKQWFDQLAQAAAGFAEKVKKAWEDAKKVFSDLNKKLKKEDGVKSVGEEYNQILAGTNLTLGAGIGAGLFVLVQQLAGVANKVKKNLKNSAEMVEKFSKVITAVKDHLKALTAEVKARALLTIAFAIGVLAASVWALSIIDPAKLTQGLIAITVLLGEVSGMLYLMSKSEGLSGGTFAKLALGLAILSISVLLMAKAVTKLAKLEPGQLVVGLLALNFILKRLARTVESMPAKDNLAKNSLGLIGLGVALIAIAQAVRMMGTLRWQDVVKGVGAFAVVLTMLAGFIEGVDLDSMGKDVGKQMIALGASLLIIAFAIEKVGKLDLAAAVQGVAAIVAILAAMAGFMRLTEKSNFSASSGVGLIALAVSMERLTGIIERLGTMDLNTLLQGLATLTYLMAAVVAVMSQVEKEALPAGAGMLLMSVALGLLVSQVFALGSMDILTLAQGLIGLSLAMGALLGAMAILSKIKPNPKAAAALILLSIALGAIVPSILLLGAAGLGPVAIGVGALVVVLLALAGTSLLLAKAVAPMQALALALLTFAAAVAVFGLGVLALGVGLATIGTAGSAGIQILTSAIQSFLSILPYMGQKLAETIVIMIAVFGDNMPTIMGAVSAFIGGMIQVFIDNIPGLIQAGVTLIISLLDALVALIPKIVETGMELILGLLRGIRDHIGEVVTVVGDIVSNFLTALGKALPKIIDAGAKMIIDFINGMAAAIDENHMALIEAMGRLGKSIINALWDALKAAFQGVFGFIVDIGGAIVRGVWEGIKGAAKWFGDQVKGFFESMVNGAKKVLGIRSPSRVFKQIGKFSMEGLSIGIEEGSSGAVAASEKASQELIDSVNEIFKGINLEDLNMEINPVVAPVLDLEKAKAGASQLDALFNSKQTISANVEAARPRKPEPVQPAPTQPVEYKTEINFTQNNTSPEALSAMDIYRNTQNQLRQIKESALSY